MPIKIHGKEYYTVAERLEILHKEYSKQCVHITTEYPVLDLEKGLCVCKATIKIGEEYLFTGHALENQNDKSSMVNKNSYVENAETSAIGRALASMGIGVDHGIASANEMASKASPKIDGVYKRKEEPDKKWYNEEHFKKELKPMQEAINDGRRTPQQILANLRGQGFSFSNKMKEQILTLRPTNKPTDV